MNLAPRIAFDWKLRTRTLPLGPRTLVMGIVNVTPDSFSDGGQYRSPHEAVEHALRMLDEGAALLDIGGESTRPGQRERLTDQEEIDRVLPVVEGILAHRRDALLSVDTYRSATARAGIAAGAEIVNDVSGFLWDEMMAQMCAELRCGVVLMHTRGRPDEWRSLPRFAQREVVPMVKRELGLRLEYALAAGVHHERIVLDPGIGFGKAYDDNYPLLAGMRELQQLGQPLLAGVSRKSFLGRTLAAVNGGVDVAVEKRGSATLAAVTAAVLLGASLVRVHEVRPAVEAAAIADAILEGAQFS
jgi:dihydropteroate synthase